MWIFCKYVTLKEYQSYHERRKHKKIMRTHKAKVNGTQIGRQGETTFRLTVSNEVGIFRFCTYQQF